jgi:hypothetical protein
MRIRAVSLVLVVLASAAHAQDASKAADFTPQVKKLFQVVACGDTAAPPEGALAKELSAHCRTMAEHIARYKTRWLDKAKPVLASIVPAGLPDKLVYPFGGGDLVTALATFPSVSEITTLSLEISGDAGKIDTIPAAKLPGVLKVIAENIRRLFAVAHSKTTNLTIISKGDLPGQLIFALVALAVHDMEPVSLKYFHLAPDGAIQYVTDADIQAAKDPKARAALFLDMEIGFRKKGDAAAPVRIYRHISANLDDKHLGADPSVVKHLEAKGKVTAMTKAASFLLWYKDFSIIRDYLLKNMEWMISDATGIQPHTAKAAGFEQITWGRFDGPFLPAGKADGAEMKKLWTDNPAQPLDFRYGYPDNAHHSHLMVTRRITKKP